MADVELVRALCALTLLLLAALVGGRVFTRLRLPPVIGEITGGLMLGPTVLGALAPDVAAWLFPQAGPVGSALALVYQIGLLLLMFLAGTQMRVLVTRADVRTVGAIAVAGIVIPFALGLAFALTVDQEAIIGPAGSELALVLVIAVAIAITSIPVISRIMLDLGIMGTPFARIVLGVAVLEDIVLTVVLSIAVGLVSTGGADAFGLPALLRLESVGASIAYHAATSVAFLVVVVALARPLRRVARVDGAGSLAPVLIAVLGASAACLALGVPPFLGAFAVGLLYGRTVARDDPHVRSIGTFAMAFFIPVYFATVGLKLDLLAHLDVLFTVLFVAFACVAKASSVYLGARLGGTGRTGSVDLAVALNARGGPGIVLASVALDATIINERFFTTLIITAVLTSLLAGWWLEAAISRGRLAVDPEDGAPPVVADAAPARTRAAST